MMQVAATSPVFKQNASPSNRDAWRTGIKISESSRRVAPAVAATAGMIRAMTERSRVTQRRRSTYKGERALIGTRVKPEFQDRVDDAASAAGVSRTDWITDSVQLGLARRDELAEMLWQIGPHRGEQLITSRVSHELKDEVDRAIRRVRTTRSKRHVGPTRDQWILAALLLRLERPVDTTVVSKVTQRPTQLSFDTSEVLEQSA
jgi:hypothetical protein